VGKISRITRSAEEGSEDRWVIGINEAARISKPDVWKHWRNPVRYVSLSELGIRVDDLKFQAVGAKEAQAKRESQAAPWPPATLTIPEAKRALAATFGVKPDAVEITIRG